MSWAELYGLRKAGVTLRSTSFSLRMAPARLTVLLGRQLAPADRGEHLRK